MSEEFLKAIVEMSDEGDPAVLRARMLLDIIRVKRETLSDAVQQSRETGSPSTGIDGDSPSFGSREQQIEQNRLITEQLLQSLNERKSRLARIVGEENVDYRPPQMVDDDDESSCASLYFDKREPCTAHDVTSTLTGNKNNVSPKMDCTSTTDSTDTSHTSECMDERICTSNDSTLTMDLVVSRKRETPVSMKCCEEVVNSSLESDNTQSFDNTVEFNSPSISVANNADTVPSEPNVKACDEVLMTNDEYAPGDRRDNMTSNQQQIFVNDKHHVQADGHSTPYSMRDFAAYLRQTGFQRTSSFDASTLTSVRDTGSQHGWARHSYSFENDRHDDIVEQGNSCKDVFDHGEAENRSLDYSIEDEKMNELPLWEPVVDCRHRIKVSSSYEEKRLDGPRVFPVRALSFEQTGRPESKICSDPPLYHFELPAQFQAFKSERKHQREQKSPQRLQVSPIVHRDCDNSSTSSLSHHSNHLQASNIGDLYPSNLKSRSRPFDDSSGRKLARPGQMDKQERKDVLPTKLAPSLTARVIVNDSDGEDLSLSIIVSDESSFDFTTDSNSSGWSSVEDLDEYIRKSRKQSMPYHPGDKVPTRGDKDKPSSLVTTHPKQTKSKISRSTVWDENSDTKLAEEEKKEDTEMRWVLAERRKSSKKSSQKVKWDLPSPIEKEPDTRASSMAAEGVDGQCQGSTGLYGVAVQSGLQFEKSVGIRAVPPEVKVSPLSSGRCGTQGSLYDIAVKSGFDLKKHGDRFNEDNLFPARGGLWDLAHSCGLTKKELHSRKAFTINTRTTLQRNEDEAILPEAITDYECGACGNLFLAFETAGGDYTAVGSLYYVATHSGMKTVR
jgi:hypothetical protein